MLNQNNVQTVKQIDGSYKTMLSLDFSSIEDYCFLIKTLKRKCFITSHIEKVKTIVTIHIELLAYDLDRLKQCFKEISGKHANRQYRAA